MYAVLLICPVIFDTKKAMENEEQSGVEQTECAETQFSFGELPYRLPRPVILLIDEVGNMKELQLCYTWLTTLQIMQKKILTKKKLVVSVFC